MIPAVELVDTKRMFLACRRWTADNGGLLPVPKSFRSLYDMSGLLAFIDAYKDAHGQPSDASIARAVGIAPQTISSWRKRGIRELPAQATLLRLSNFLDVPYPDVLEAVLVDTGYMQKPQKTPPSGEVRGA